MAKKAKTPAPKLAEGELTLEQCTGIIEIGRNARTDAAARVPPGTLESLVALGYAVNQGDMYYPTATARAKCKEWLERSIREAARRASERSASPPATAEPGGAKRAPPPKGTGGKTKYTPERKIKMLGDGKNPWKPGSKQFLMHNLCVTSNSVGHYLERGGDKTALSYFVYRKTVEIT